MSKVYWQLSSQVDLLPKSETSDGIAIGCDITGITLLAGSGGTGPWENFKNWNSLDMFSFILSENVMP